MSGVTDAGLRRLEGEVANVGEMLDDLRGRGRHTRIPRLADDPVSFCEQSGRPLIDYEADILRSYVENRFTVVRGAHGIGKEYLAGCAATHGAFARGMLVLVVSATEGQVLNQTMKEVRSAARSAVTKYALTAQVFRGSVRIGTEDRIIPLTGSAAVDALTGWHDPKGVLWIISEGQGERLEDAAYDAAISSAVDRESRILAMGNPARPVGRFYEINQKAHWKVFRVSAFDTPNVKAGRVIVPGLPGPEWPGEVAKEYGPESAYYRARVLAEFPIDAEESLIRQDWIDAAVDRWKAGTFEHVAADNCVNLVVGVDPARLGPDRTVLCVRRGGHVREFRSWKGQDTMASARRVHGIVEELAAQVPVASVHVDCVGLGAGVLDRLKETLPGIEAWALVHGHARRMAPRAVPFDAGKRAGQPARFTNLRAQAYWYLRKLLEEGRIALPPDAALREELIATHVQFTADGRVQIAPKDEIKTRLGRSPDLADALVISLAPELEDDRPRGRVSAPLASLAHKAQRLVRIPQQRRAS